MSGSEAEEMRDWLGRGINAHRHLGKSEAVFRVARELGMPSSRVTKILRGEITRVWADEWRAAQRWYIALCDRMEAQAVRDAEQYRERRAALVRRIECGSDT